MPKIPLDPFQSCNFVVPATPGWAYRLQVALAGVCYRLSRIYPEPPHMCTDLIAFVCIVVFVSKLKAENGQSRMTRLMRAILQDGVLYFFVMMGFHIAMLLVTVFAGVITLLPHVGRYVLMS